MLEVEPISQKMYNMHICNEISDEREALELSIAKYAYILSKKPMLPYDVGYHSCGLCWLYSDSGCSGCPISTRTKEPGCKETPWYDVNFALIELKYTGKGMDEFFNAVEKEIDFLYSLDSDLPTRDELIKKHVVDNENNLSDTV